MVGAILLIALSVRASDTSNQFSSKFCVLINENMYNNKKKKCALKRVTKMKYYGWHTKIRYFNWILLIRWCIWSGVMSSSYTYKMNGTIVHAHIQKNSRNTFHNNDMAYVFIAVYLQDIWNEEKLKIVDSFEHRCFFFSLFQ